MKGVSEKSKIIILTEKKKEKFVTLDKSRELITIIEYIRYIKI